MNPMWMLNVMHSEGPTKTTLMHVQVVVNGARVKIMVDSRATHIFMASRGASWLGLN